MEDLYDSAIGLFNKGKYEEAIENFSKLIHFYPTSKLVPYSQYTIGQSFLKLEKYERALEQFELYLKTYPDFINPSSSPEISERPFKRPIKG